jgi:dihydroneopterin triphosphate diphosphatase
VVPQYTFGTDVAGHAIRLSAEHTTCQWTDYHTAHGVLFYQSNRTALWELHHRLTHTRPSIGPSDGGTVAPKRQPS